MDKTIGMCMLLGALLLAGPASAQQAPPMSCEERLTALEKFVLILRDERERAQQTLSHAWSLAERYEREKNAVPVPPQEPAK